MGSPSLHRRHAVVVGGSMNGMAVGRELSEHFEQVTLIDRDTLDDVAEVRRRAPQGFFPNLLQMVGRQELEVQFPGLMKSLTAQGAYLFEMGSEVARFSRWGWTPNTNVDRSSLACTRPCVEITVRRLLRKHSRNVTIVDGTAVTGYRFTGEGASLRVVGVETDSEDERYKSMDADLVVDCGGRGTKGHKWLEERGIARPSEIQVDAHTNYATRYYQPPAEAKDWWWKVIAIEAVPPFFKRGAVLLPTEDGRWLVTAIGVDGDYAPTDNDAWLEWIRGLRSDAMARVLDRAEPLTDVQQSRTTVNFWRQMHKQRQHVAGLILFGDAIAGFNPSYGQGITAGVVSSRLLGRLLRGGRAIDSMVVRDYYHQQAKILQEGWRYSTSLDFRWTGTTGKRPLMLPVEAWVGSWLDEAGAHDPEVLRRILPLLDFGANHLSVANPDLFLRVWAYKAKQLFNEHHLVPAPAFDPFSSERPMMLGRDTHAAESGAR